MHIYSLLFLTTVLSLVNCIQLKGQVTIGASLPPEKGAILDLKQQNPDTNNITANTGGLLLPRVKLEDRNSLRPIITDTDPDLENLKRSHVGLMVYNLGKTESTVTDKNEILKEGIYTWNGQLWSMYVDHTEESDISYFYLPSFNLPITSLGNKTYNLYEEYVKQYTEQGNTKWTASNPHLSKISRIYQADELDYVVTDISDDTVLKVKSISPLGVMNYEVFQTTADPNFYINIVIVIK